LVGVQESIDYLQEWMPGRENLVQAGEINRQGRSLGVSQEHFMVTDGVFRGVRNSWRRWAHRACGVPSPLSAGPEPI
jgi:hypothetical protein